MQTAFRLALFCLTWLAGAACAADLTAEMTTREPVIAPVSTHHAVKIGSRRLRYTATFAETALNDANGQLQATISSTSYVREEIHDRAARPVMFAFNGGPGASSSPLHFGALGPRRWVNDADGSRRIVENPFTLLDAADLVFIDPVGTGFSRLRTGDGSAYWSIAGDAQSVLTLIRNWLQANGRMAAPVFIVGESYGGFRLATLANQLDEIRVAGVILISPLLDASATADAPGNDLPFVFELPSLAAGAWYHEKIDRKNRSLAQVFEEAAAFAQSEYIVALQQGAALPAARKQQLATRISELIGLPATAIEAANLRIDSEFFLQTLLSDRKQLVGRLDMRVTAPKPTEPPKDPNRPPAADDPALGLKGSNVIRSAQIKTYFEKDLGVRTIRDYLSLTLDVNFRWNWQGDARSPGFYVNPTANLATLMTRQPQSKLLLLGGYYDLATPLMGPRYALTHAGVPLERTIIRTFDAGHSPFEGESHLAQVSQVIHSFVRGELQK